MTEETEEQEAGDLNALASQLQAGAHIELTEDQTRMVENEFPADWLDGAESGFADEAAVRGALQSSEPRPASPAADAGPEDVQADVVDQSVVDDPQARKSPQIGRHYARPAEMRSVTALKAHAPARTVRQGSQQQLLRKMW